jgi:hypothetical protein
MFFYCSLNLLLYCNSSSDSNAWMIISKELFSRKKNSGIYMQNKELKERGGRLCLQNVFSSKQDEEEQFGLRWK